MDANEGHPGTRVAQAAEYLDREYPGWAERVDLTDFAMDQADKCVAWYAVGWETDDIDAWETVRRDCSDAGINTGGLFSHYQTEWIEEIKTRKEAGNVSA